MKRGTQYFAAVLVGVALLTVLSTADAATVKIDGIKVVYDRPIAAGWGAYYDQWDQTLTIEIEQQAQGGNLLVKALENAYQFWPGYVDVYISAPSADIASINLIGRDGLRFYVVGEVDSCRKFKLNWGTVGGTWAYGPYTGLYQWDFDPWGMHGARWPKKVLVKNGFSPAPALAPIGFLGSPTRVKGEKVLQMVSESESEALSEAKSNLAESEADDEEEEEDDEKSEDDDSSANADFSPGDKVAIFQSLLLNAE